MGAWVDARGPRSLRSAEEVWRLSGETATSWAALGLVPGQVVATLVGPPCDMVVTLLAAWRSGLDILVWPPHRPTADALAVLRGEPLAAWVRSDGGERIAEAAGPRWQQAPVGRDEVRPGSGVATAPALLLLTSGTSGVPKAVEHGLASLEAGIATLLRLWGMQPEDRLVLQLPLFHVHGLCLGLLGPLWTGHSVVCGGRFDPEELLREAAEGATVFFGVPAMYQRLLRQWPATHPAWQTLARMRLFTSGSAPLPVADAAAFEARTGHRILERYGMTETLLTLTNPLDGERVPGQVGRPLPGVEATLAPIPGLDRAGWGELLVRGATLARGYRGAASRWADAFTPEGWFRTGDVASLDEQGRYSIHGRAALDFAKVSGWRVGFLEVEAALRGAEGVEEVLVVSVPDATTGEALVAWIVARVGCPAQGVREACEQVATRDLPAYMRPARVLLCDALPRNAMGKVDRLAARAQAQAQAPPTLAHP